MSRAVKLNNGVDHPLLGFGTYKVGFVPASASSTTGGGEAVDCATVIKSAISNGYKFLDCAQFYGNEKGIGEGIKGCGVPREELFIASKVWNDTVFAGKEAVRKQVETCLSDIGVEYVDLFLVHWPVPKKHVDAYKVLEEMVSEGKIKSIGVSNYTVEDYEELMQTAKINPVVNQIEINPFLYRKITIEYFKGKGVQLQSYRALRQSKELANPVIVKIAEKHGKTPAQVLGRYCVQRDIVYIAKSVKVERMIENAGVFDFSLDEDDYATLDELTTDVNISEFKKLYEKCTIRDTPLAESKEGLRTKYTAY